MNDQEREDAARVQLEQAADRLEADLKAGVFDTAHLVASVADEPLDLPPALTERERFNLTHGIAPTSGQVRALELIDAAAALMAEQAAQIVVDGRRIADLEAEIKLAWDDEDETKRANVAEKTLAAANALLVRVDDALENEGPYLPLLYQIRDHLRGLK